MAPPAMYAIALKRDVAINGIDSSSATTTTQRRGSLQTSSK